MPLPRIPEILKLICDNLIDEKKTLARLARTCQDFHEPAINVLWYEMEGFYPLAACLPPHIISIEGDELSQCVELSQPLTSLNSCDRLYYYSARVRSYIDSPDSCRKFVDKQVYEAVHLVTQGIKILPNVRQLTWNCHDENFPYICMFMGPYLTKLELTVAPDSLTHLSLLSVLPERHRCLTDISFYFGAVGSDNERKIAVKSISNFIHMWQNLKSLEVYNLTYPALYELSQLPQLHRLALKRCQLEIAAPFPTAKGGFPALNDLLLKGCSKVSDCIAVLKLTDHSPISFFRATFIGMETSASLNSLFETLAERFNRTTFQQLEIKDGKGVDSTLRRFARNEMVKFDVLQPLFIFRRMRWVSIEVTRGIFIYEPGLLEDMLTSWIMIQELLVKSRPFARGAVPLITLNDVIRIAGRSPLLQILGLAFDANSPPQLDDDANTDSISVIATNLKELYVGDSPIKNPNLVAASLSGAFPFLKSIKTVEDEEDFIKRRHGENGPTHKVWKKAEEMLQVISAVRRQERLYAELQYRDDEEEEEEEDGSDEEE